jgi:hypothetical protein
MGGDRRVPDPAPLVGEGREDEREAVGQSRGHEEVGRHDLADVSPHERAPGLRRRPTPAPHVFRDGRLTDLDHELQ